MGTHSAAPVRSATTRVGRLSTRAYWMRLVVIIGILAVASAGILAYLNSSATTATHKEIRIFSASAGQTVTQYWAASDQGDFDSRLRPDGSKVSGNTDHWWNHLSGSDQSANNARGFVNQLVKVEQIGISSSNGKIYRDWRVVFGSGNTYAGTSTYGDITNIGWYDRDNTATQNSLTPSERTLTFTFSAGLKPVAADGSTNNPIFRVGYASRPFEIPSIYASDAKTNLYFGATSGTNSRAYKDLSFSTTKSATKTNAAVNLQTSQVSVGSKKFASLLADYDQLTHETYHANSMTVYGNDAYSMTGNSWAATDGMSNTKDLNHYSSAPDGAKLSSSDSKFSEKTANATDNNNVWSKGWDSDGSAKGLFLNNVQRSVTLYDKPLTNSSGLSDNYRHLPVVVTFRTVDVPEELLESGPYIGAIYNNRTGISAPSYPKYAVAAHAGQIKSSSIRRLQVNANWSGTRGNVEGVSLKFSAENTEYTVPLNDLGKNQSAAYPLAYYSTQTSASNVAFSNLGLEGGTLSECTPQADGSNICYRPYGYSQAVKMVMSPLQVNGAGQGTDVQDISLSIVDRIKLTPAPTTGLVDGSAPTETVSAGSAQYYYNSSNITSGVTYSFGQGATTCGLIMNSETGQISGTPNLASCNKSFGEADYLDLTLPIEARYNNEVATAERTLRIYRDTDSDGEPDGAENGVTQVDGKNIDTDDDGDSIPDVFDNTQNDYLGPKTVDKIKVAPENTLVKFVDNGRAITPKALISINKGFTDTAANSISSNVKSYLSLEFAPADQSGTATGSYADSIDLGGLTISAKRDSNITTPASKFIKAYISGTPAATWTDNEYKKVINFRIRAKYTCPTAQTKATDCNYDPEEELPSADVRVVIQRDSDGDGQIDGNSDMGSSEHNADLDLEGYPSEWDDDDDNDGFPDSQSWIYTGTQGYNHYLKGDNTDNRNRLRFDAITINKIVDTSKPVYLLEGKSISGKDIYIANKTPGKDGNLTQLSVQPCGASGQPTCSSATPQYSDFGTKIDQSSDLVVGSEASGINIVKVSDGHVYHSGGTPHVSWPDYATTQRDAYYQIDFNRNYSCSRITGCKSNENDRTVVKYVFLRDSDRDGRPDELPAGLENVRLNIDGETVSADPDDNNDNIDDVTQIANAKAAGKTEAEALEISRTINELRITNDCSASYRAQTGVPDCTITTTKGAGVTFEGISTTNSNVTVNSSGSLTQSSANYSWGTADNVTVTITGKAKFVAPTACTSTSGTAESDYYRYTSANQCIELAKFTLTLTPQRDTDLDGVVDESDSDDDGDGLPDSAETTGSSNGSAGGSKFFDPLVLTQKTDNAYYTSVDTSRRGYVIRDIPIANQPLANVQIVQTNRDTTPATGNRPTLLSGNAGSYNSSNRLTSNVGALGLRITADGRVEGEPNFTWGTTNGVPKAYDFITLHVQAQYNKAADGTGCKSQVDGKCPSFSNLGPKNDGVIFKVLRDFDGDNIDDIYDPDIDNDGILDYSDGQGHDPANLGGATKIDPNPYAFTPINLSGKKTEIHVSERDPKMITDGLDETAKARVAGAEIGTLAYGSQSSVSVSKGNVTISSPTSSQPTVDLSQIEVLKVPVENSNQAKIVLRGVKVTDWNDQSIVTLNVPYEVRRTCQAATGITSGTRCDASGTTTVSDQVSLVIYRDHDNDGKVDGDAANTVIAAGKLDTAAVTPDDDDDNDGWPDLATTSGGVDYSADPRRWAPDPLVVYITNMKQGSSTTTGFSSTNVPDFTTPSYRFVFASGENIPTTRILRANKPGVEFVSSSTVGGRSIAADGTLTSVVPTVTSDTTVSLEVTAKRACTTTEGAETCAETVQVPTLTFEAFPDIDGDGGYNSLGAFWYRFNTMSDLAWDPDSDGDGIADGDEAEGRRYGYDAIGTAVNANKTFAFVEGKPTATAFSASTTSDAAPEAANDTALLSFAKNYSAQWADPAFAPGGGIVITSPAGVTCVSTSEQGTTTYANWANGLCFDNEGNLLGTPSLAEGTWSDNLDAWTFTEKTEVPVDIKVAHPCTSRTSSKCGVDTNGQGWERETKTINVNVYRDTDRDGWPDEFDTDDDNDGYTDAVEKTRYVAAKAKSVTGEALNRWNPKAYTGLVVDQVLTEVFEHKALTNAHLFTINTQDANFELGTATIDNAAEGKGTSIPISATGLSLTKLPLAQTGGLPTVALSGTFTGTWGNDTKSERPFFTLNVPLSRACSATGSTACVAGTETQTAQLSIRIFRDTDADGKPDYQRFDNNGVTGDTDDDGDGIPDVSDGTEYPGANQATNLLGLRTRSKTPDGIAITVAGNLPLVIDGQNITPAQAVTVSPEYGKTISGTQTLGLNVDSAGNLTGTAAAGSGVTWTEGYYYDAQIPVTATRTCENTYGCATGTASDTKNVTVRILRDTDRDGTPDGPAGNTGTMTGYSGSWDADDDGDGFSDSCEDNPPTAAGSATAACPLRSYSERQVYDELLFDAGASGAEATTATGATLTFTEGQQYADFDAATNTTAAVNKGFNSEVKVVGIGLPGGMEAKLNTADRKVYLVTTGTGKVSLPAGATWRAERNYSGNATVTVTRPCTQSGTSCVKADTEITLTVPYVLLQDLDGDGTADRDDTDPDGDGLLTNGSPADANPYTFDALSATNVQPLVVVDGQQVTGDALKAVDINKAGDSAVSITSAPTAANTYDGEHLSGNSTATKGISIILGTATGENHGHGVLNGTPNYTAEGATWGTKTSDTFNIKYTVFRPCSGEPCRVALGAAVGTTDLKEQNGGVVKVYILRDTDGDGRPDGRNGLPAGLSELPSGITLDADDDGDGLPNSTDSSFYDGSAGSAGNFATWSAPGAASTLRGGSVTIVDPRPEPGASQTWETVGGTALAVADQKVGLTSDKYLGVDGAALSVKYGAAQTPAAEITTNADQSGLKLEVDNTTAANHGKVFVTGLPNIVWGEQEYTRNVNIGYTLERPCTFGPTSACSRGKETFSGTITVTVLRQSATDNGALKADIDGDGILNENDTAAKGYAGPLTKDLFQIYEGPRSNNKIWPTLVTPHGSEPIFYVRNGENLSTTPLTVLSVDPDREPNRTITALEDVDTGQRIPGVAVGSTGAYSYYGIIPMPGDLTLSSAYTTVLKGTPTVTNFAEDKAYKDMRVHATIGRNCKAVSDQCTQYELTFIVRVLRDTDGDTLPDDCSGKPECTSDTDDDNDGILDSADPAANSDSAARSFDLFQSSRHRNVKAFYVLENDTTVYDFAEVYKQATNAKVMPSNANLHVEAVTQNAFGDTVSGQSALDTDTKRREAQALTQGDSLSSSPVLVTQSGTKIQFQRQIGNTITWESGENQRTYYFKYSVVRDCDTALTGCVNEKESLTDFVSVTVLRNTDADTDPDGDNTPDDPGMAEDYEGNRFSADVDDDGDGILDTDESAGDVKSFNSDWNIEQTSPVVVLEGRNYLDQVSDNAPTSYAAKRFAKLLRTYGVTLSATAKLDGSGADVALPGFTISRSAARTEDGSSLSAGRLGLVTGKSTVEWSGDNDESRHYVVTYTYSMPCPAVVPQNVTCNGTLTSEANTFDFYVLRDTDGDGQPDKIPARLTNTGLTEDVDDDGDKICDPNLSSTPDSSICTGTDSAPKSAATLSLTSHTVNLIDGVPVGFKVGGGAFDSLYAVEINNNDAVAGKFDYALSSDNLAAAKESAPTSHQEIHGLSISHVTASNREYFQITGTPNLLGNNTTDTSAYKTLVITLRAFCAGSTSTCTATNAAAYKDTEIRVNIYRDTDGDGAINAALPNHVTGDLYGPGLGTNSAWTTDTDDDGDGVPDTADTGLGWTTLAWSANKQQDDVNVVDGETLDLTPISATNKAGANLSLTMTSTEARGLTVVNKKVTGKANSGLNPQTDGDSVTASVGFKVTATDITCAVRSVATWNGLWTCPGNPAPPASIDDPFNVIIEHDTDGDSIGDSTDPDIDGDGIANSNDTAKYLYNSFTLSGSNFPGSAALSNDTDGAFADDEKVLLFVEDKQDSRVGLYQVTKDATGSSIPATTTNVPNDKIAIKLLDSTGQEITSAMGLSLHRHTDSTQSINGDQLRFSGVPQTPSGTTPEHPYSVVHLQAQVSHTCSGSAAYCANHNDIATQRFAIFVFKDSDGDGDADGKWNIPDAIKTAATQQGVTWDFDDDDDDDGVRNSADISNSSWAAWEIAQSPLTVTAGTTYTSNAESTANPKSEALNAFTSNKTIKDVHLRFAQANGPDDNRAVSAEQATADVEGLKLVTTGNSDTNGQILDPDPAAPITLQGKATLGADVPDKMVYIRYTLERSCVRSTNCSTGTETITKVLPVKVINSAFYQNGTLNEDADGDGIKNSEDTSPYVGALHPDVLVVSTANGTAGNTTHGNSADDYAKYQAFKSGDYAHVLDAGDTTWTQANWNNLGSISKTTVDNIQVIEGKEYGESEKQVLFKISPDTNAVLDPQLLGYIHLDKEYAFHGTTLAGMAVKLEATAGGGMQAVATGQPVMSLPWSAGEDSRTFTIRMMVQRKCSTGLTFAADTTCPWQMVEFSATVLRDTDRDGKPDNAGRQGTDSAGLTFDTDDDGDGILNANEKTGQAKTFQSFQNTWQQNGNVSAGTFYVVQGQEPASFNAYTFAKDMVTGTEFTAQSPAPTLSFTSGGAAAGQTAAVSGFTAQRNGNQIQVTKGSGLPTDFDSSGQKVITINTRLTRDCGAKNPATACHSGVDALEVPIRIVYLKNTDGDDKFDANLGTITDAAGTVRNEDDDKDDDGIPNGDDKDGNTDRSTDYDAAFTGQPHNVTVINGQSVASDRYKAEDNKYPDNSKPVTGINKTLGVQTLWATGSADYGTDSVTFSPETGLTLKNEGQTISLSGTPNYSFSDDDEQAVVQVKVKLTHECPAVNPLCETGTEDKEYSFNITVLRDSDNDGIPDTEDSDDDNDGIPDTKDGSSKNAATFDITAQDGLTVLENRQITLSGPSLEHPDTAYQPLAFTSNKPNLSYAVKVSRANSEGDTEAVSTDAGSVYGMSIDANGRLTGTPAGLDWTGVTGATQDVLIKATLSVTWPCDGTETARATCPRSESDTKVVKVTVYRNADRDNAYDNTDTDATQAESVTFSDGTNASGDDDDDNDGVRDNIDQNKGQWDAITLSGTNLTLDNGAAVASNYASNKHAATYRYSYYEGASALFSAPYGLTFSPSGIVGGTATLGAGDTSKTVRVQVTATYPCNASLAGGGVTCPESTTKDFTITINQDGDGDGYPAVANDPTVTQDTNNAVFNPFEITPKTNAVVIDKGSAVGMEIATFDNKKIGTVGEGILVLSHALESGDTFDENGTATGSTPAVAISSNPATYLVNDFIITKDKATGKIMLLSNQPKMNWGATESARQVSMKFTALRPCTVNATQCSGGYERMTKKVSFWVLRDTDRDGRPDGAISGSNPTLPAGAPNVTWDTDNDGDGIANSRDTQDNGYAGPMVADPVTISGSDTVTVLENQDLAKKVYDLGPDAAAGLRVSIAGPSSDAAGGLSVTWDDESGQVKLGGRAAFSDWSAATYRDFTYTVSATRICDDDLCSGEAGAPSATRTLTVRVLKNLDGDEYPDDASGASGFTTDTDRDGDGILNANDGTNGEQADAFNGFSISGPVVVVREWQTLNKLALTNNKSDDLDTQLRFGSTAPTAGSDLPATADPINGLSLVRGSDNAHGYLSAPTPIQVEWEDAAESARAVNLHYEFLRPCTSAVAGGACTGGTEKAFGTLKVIILRDTDGDGKPNEVPSATDGTNISADDLDLITRLYPAEMIDYDDDADGILDEDDDADGIPDAEESEGERVVFNSLQVGAATVPPLPYEQAVPAGTKALDVRQTLNTTISVESVRIAGKSYPDAAEGATTGEPIGDDGSFFGLHIGPRGVLSGTPTGIDWNTVSGNSLTLKVLVRTSFTCPADIGSNYTTTCNTTTLINEVTLVITRPQPPTVTTPSTGGGSSGGGYIQPVSNPSPVAPVPAPSPQPAPAPAPAPLVSLTDPNRPVTEYQPITAKDPVVAVTVPGATVSSPVVDGLKISPEGRLEGTPQRQWASDAEESVQVTIPVTVHLPDGQDVTSPVTVTIWRDTDKNGVPDVTDTDDDGDSIPDGLDRQRKLQNAIGREISVSVGHVVDDGDIRRMIRNLDLLPPDVQVALRSTIFTRQPGTVLALLRVTYPDGRVEDLEVPVTIVGGQSARQALAPATNAPQDALLQPVTAAAKPVLAPGDYGRAPISTTSGILGSLIFALTVALAASLRLFLAGKRRRREQH